MFFYVYDSDGNIVRSIDIRSKKEYNYEYEEGRIVRATEANIELNGEIYAWKYLKGMYSDSPQNRLEFWAYSASDAHVDRLWEDSPSRYPIYFIVGLLGSFWGK